LKKGKPYYPIVKWNAFYNIFKSSPIYLGIAINENLIQVITLTYIKQLSNGHCNTTTHIGFCDWFKKWLLYFSKMFTTTWSQ
jgi:hypothetical protein